jgi:MYXO-CTERM domain-containing protein
MRSIRLKTCAVALAAALSVPAFAQGTSGTGTAGSTGTTTSADTTIRHETGRGFDWGWLGLLGLAGLLGRRRQPDVHRVDPARTTAR